MKIELSRDLLSFDASRCAYSQLVVDVAPATWRVARYDEAGEDYAIDDLSELQRPVVVASLAVDDFFSPAGLNLIDHARVLSLPIAVLAGEIEERKFGSLETVKFIPKIPGEVSKNLQQWFDSLRVFEE